MAFIAQPPLFRPSQTHHATSNRLNTSMALSRRSCIQLLAAVAITLPSPLPSLSAMYSADTKSDTFAPKGDLSKVSTYMPQIEAGYDVLVELENEWDLRTRDYDGDVVRRVLGTVGVKSPLFNIRKSFLKSWQIIANSAKDYELVDRLESEWNEILSGISTIDFQLYSVSFTELTESKISLLANAKKALDDTIVIYSDLLKDIRSVT